MTTDYLLACTLPLLGGFLLALLVVDLAIGKRDRSAKRSRAVLAAIVALAEGGLIVWRIISTSHPEPFITQPQVPLMDVLPSQSTLDTQARLDDADIPVHDPDALQARLGVDLSIPSLPVPLPQHDLGDRREFVLQGRLVEAELVHVSGPIHAWLVYGVQADRTALVDAIDRFATEVQPSVRQFFGRGLAPESDSAVHILHYSDPQDGVHGFFLPETEMFHVNLAHVSLGAPLYLGTLVHELQHALQWQMDPNEERWLDEGLSELAELSAGFDPGESDEVFREAFDTQLNLWPYAGEGMPPTVHYGASYRFVLYLWERFGDDFIRDLSHHPVNGLRSVDVLLAARDTGLTADDVFADWVLANAVDEGAYAYEHEDWKASMPTWAKATFYRYPMDIQTDVPPYATDYYRLENTRPSLIHFVGTTQARILPADPHSGETCWWSNAAHHSDTRLTRGFDLSALSEATLRFWMWYDMGSAGSHVYLSASRDGGQTWAALEGARGWGYTGQSDGWVEESVDLGHYVGGTVLVRFDYVTRHGALDRGFLLDDLIIPELGLEDACEEVGDWQAEGFLLAGPMVPVQWVVQVIDIYREGHTLQVYRMSLDDSQTGQLEMELRSLGGLLGNKGRGFLAISALARGTTVPLPYHCEILRQ
jgi:immune inhibitor InhA-like protein